MPTRGDFFTAADDFEDTARKTVGESSQPDTHRNQQPEHQKILFPDHAAALPAGGFNGSPIPAGQAFPGSPLTKLAQDMDDMSYESMSGTSSVSQPIPLQNPALKSHNPRPSLDTSEGGPSGASSVSSLADHHARAELSGAARLSLPQNSLPLNTATSTRNGAPTSPIPLYAQNLMDDHQLWCHSSDNSVSEPEFAVQATTHTYPPDFMEITSAMKRKRKHPDKVSEKEPSAADPDVATATQDVIALLQIYGPLSYVQLRVNIETQFEGEDSVPVKKLQQVLDILVELGVIHIVEGANDPGRTSATEAGSELDATNNNPVYCFGSGAPRIDAVLPPNVLDEITEAGNEIFETEKRIDFLRSVLRIDQPSASTEADGEKKPSKCRPQTQEYAKKALGQMLEKHPDIVNDPSYVAAMRLFKVQDTTQQNEKKRSASEDGTGSPKKRKRPKPNNTSAIDAIAESKTGIDSPQINQNKSAS